MKKLCLLIAVLALTSACADRSPVTVVGFEWNYSIDIMATRTVSESDWNIPKEGRKTSEAQAVHHYYLGSCYGTYFSMSGKIKFGLHPCQKPAYQTKYAYDIERLVTVRTVEAHGTDRHPYWPDATNLGDGESEGTRHTNHIVFVKNKKGEVKKFSCSEDEWRRLELDKAYRPFYKHSELAGVEEISERK